MKFHSDNSVKLHTAIRVVDWHGRVLKKEILYNLAINNIVRISLQISKREWYSNISYDSPYVIIKDIRDGHLLGEILDKYRSPNIKYPLRTGEHIWFSYNNIIEIPIQWYNEDFSKYYTDEYVQYTGPRSLVELIEDSDSDSGSDGADESDVETDSRIPIRGAQYKK